jgi:hypothetical protein
LDNALEQWTQKFINDVTSCMRIKSILQHIGFTCEFHDDLVEIAVFPAPVEHKGQLYFPEFEFSVQNMIAKFDKVSNISWTASYLSIEGEYDGHPVWFKFYPREPRIFDRIVVSLN